MKNRSELREIIMKVIYQVLIYDNTNLNYSVDDLIEEQIEIENDYVETMVHGILENKDALFHLANKYLVDWKIERLNKVDQVILCLGIYELMYTETPAVVSFNESIELSHKYSEESVTKMINWVLDNIYHSGDYNE